MKLHFFTIPIRGGEAAAEELNRFISSHRIVSMDRSFVQDGANSAWAVCVTFESAEGGETPAAGKRGKIDYREVLNEQDFALFAKLRALRNELADKEGAPPYVVLSNEQLAELVKRRVTTEAAMREIAGIGDARIKKYGQLFLSLLQEAVPKLNAPTPPEAF